MSDFKAIYDQPISSIKGITLDMSAYATPRRFRLIDCTQLVQDERLRIHECKDIRTDILYAAISYVWRGNPVDAAHPADSESTFAVKGAEDGDPISISVLKHACVAALQSNATHIWLDRLCLIQTSRDDKAWQIARMHNVYRLCEICIILPGGIQRLVGLDEETAWIHRAWTLQEVLLPKQAVVLYAWKLGSGSWEYPSPTECVVTEVTSEQSAVSPVVDVLEASIGSLCYGRFARGDDLWTRWPAIFRSTISKHESTARAGLAQVISLLAALDLIDDDAREQAIWRCALMRTSSRPVDMVFSIMGLFGVELDARAFGKDDRLGATIALAQGILEKGGTASWLAVSFYLAPCKQLSSFPEFPRTSVEGRAYVETDRGVREVAALVGGEYDVGWSLEDVPMGRMDDRGYLELNAKAAPIVPTGQRQDGFKGGIDNMWAGKALVDIDGAVWRVVGELQEDSPSPRRFAVFIGTQEAFPLRSQSRWHAGWGVRAILVEEHAPRRFHRTSCFMLGDVFKAVVDGWGTHAIAIGGPED